jgi:hypothetical protein
MLFKSSAAIPIGLLQARSLCTVAPMYIRRGTAQPHCSIRPVSHQGLINAANGRKGLRSGQPLSSGAIQYCCCRIHQITTHSCIVMQYGHMITTQQVHARSGIRRRTAHIIHGLWARRVATYYSGTALTWPCAKVPESRPVKVQVQVCSGMFYIRLRPSTAIGCGTKQ